MFQNKTYYFIFIHFPLFWVFFFFQALWFKGIFLGFAGRRLFFVFAVNGKPYELYAKIQLYLHELSSLVCTEFFNCFSYSLKYSRQELEHPFVI